MDCTIYRGASNLFFYLGGGALLNQLGELIGITYQNIIINMGDEKDVKSVEIPNPSFAFSKEILIDIVNYTLNRKKLSDLWVFKVIDERLNKLITWDIHSEAKY